MEIFRNDSAEYAQFGNALLKLIVYYFYQFLNQLMTFFLILCYKQVHNRNKIPKIFLFIYLNCDLQMFNYYLFLKTNFIPNCVSFATKQTICYE